MTGVTPSKDAPRLSINAHARLLPDVCIYGVVGWGAYFGE
jgi:hypothetical protein